MNQHNQHTDILDQLGLLPSEHQHDDNTSSTIAERRHAPRIPTTRPVRIVMLNGDQPLGKPFHATATDVSRTGIRLTGNAPLLTGARAAIELTDKHHNPAVLGAIIKHSTFGNAIALTNDDAATAGLEFQTLPDHLVRQHFTNPDGSIALDADAPPRHT